MQTTKTILLLGLLCNLLSYSQCPGNLFLNGNFDGVEGTDTTALHWDALFDTPDVNDHIGPPHASGNWWWTSTPIESPTGGTWQSFGGPEIVGQTVVLDSGSNYTLCVDYTSTPIESVIGPLGDSTRLQIMLNDSIIHQTDIDYTPFIWDNTCINFTAVIDTNTIAFRTEFSIVPNLEGYFSIDNACLFPSEWLSQTTLETKLNIYPNPFSDFLIFDFESNNFKIRIFNALGEELMVFSELSQKEKIDLAFLESGIYIVLIEDLVNLNRYSKNIVKN